MTRNRGEIPTFEARKRLLAEILYGLRTLHTRGLAHNDLSAGNIMIREGTLEPVLIDYSTVGPLGPSDEQQADLKPSFGRGFRFIAAMVLNWIPWRNILIVGQSDKSIVKVNYFSGDPPPLEFNEEERKLLKQLTGPDNLEEPTHPTRFEEIEDLLI